MGKPVAYGVDESEGSEAYIEQLNEIFEYNDEQDHNSELAKEQSIKGIGYELLFLDEEGSVRLALLPRQSVIYVESDDLKGDPVMAVRIYSIEEIGGAETTTSRHYYEVYTENEIILYEMRTGDNTKSLYEISRQPHFFDGVPVVAYPNNAQLMGDFEGVKTLIDAYNIAQSDTANDFEYFTDAYLKLTGAQLDDKQIATMRENRVIVMPEKDCDAAFLIKDINDTAIENFKNRLRRDIHALSKTPNLTDEQFAGQLSGVAIAYKLWGMEQIAAIKERKFKRGLQRRIELITNIINLKGKSYDWRDINVIFSRNMPQNLVEIVEMVTKLKDTVSEETLLAQIPFVEDVQEEIVRLEAEREGQVDLEQYVPQIQPGIPPQEEVEVDAE